jgi:hypothetical protein
VNLRELRTHLHQQDAGGYAERHQVAQTIELSAEVARYSCQPRNATIEHVEQHREEDQCPTEHEVVRRFGGFQKLTGRLKLPRQSGRQVFRPRDPRRDDDRKEPADQVPQRKDRRKQRNCANASHAIKSVFSRDA